MEKIIQRKKLKKKQYKMLFMQTLNKFINLEFF